MLEVDKDGNGVIDYDEFSQAMKGVIQANALVIVNLDDQEEEEKGNFEEKARYLR